MYGTMATTLCLFPGAPKGHAKPYMINDAQKCNEHLYYIIDLTLTLISKKKRQICNKKINTRGAECGCVWHVCRIFYDTWGHLVAK